MTDIAQAMRYKIDVKNGLVKQPMAGVLMRGDKKANRIIAELVDGDKTVSLDGVTVTGKFFRGGDGIEIPLEGAASGNEAIVLLDEHCYAVDGYFEASVKLTTGGATRTILTITGHVESDGEGGILDVEHVIPSVEDIVAQYQLMKEVTQNTEKAGNAATAAASAATGAAESATAAAQSASSAASAATTAAQTANAAAARLDGMTATASSLPSGSDPTVDVTTGEEGAKRLAFGIPKGATGPTGATPKLKVNVATGEPGTEASVVQSGTAEAPVLDLTIPRGNDGYVGKDGATGPRGAPGIIISDTEPEDPEVMAYIDPAGVAPKIDADTLGGKLPSEYVTEESLNELKSEMGLKMDLLWTNASPDSIFYAQTINLDLSKYKLVLIEAYYEVPPSMILQTIVFRVGCGNALMAFGAEGDSANIRRKVTVNTDSIYFDIGGFNSTTNDNYARPYRIYGIK